MAGLMSRFTTLFKVRANTMLNKAEDPGQRKVELTGDQRDHERDRQGQDH